MDADSSPVVGCVDTANMVLTVFGSGKVVWSLPAVACRIDRTMYIAHKNTKKAALPIFEA